MSDVPRSRLTDRLCAQAHWRALVVVAPAGSGKTRMVRQYAARWDGLQVWHRCEEADRDAGAFGRRLLRTIGIVTGSQGAVPEGRDVEAAVGIGLSRILESVEEPLLVVLDEVETIAGEGASVRLVGRLLDLAPEGSQIVVCGRNELGLPRLPRLALDGEAGFVGRDDLAFDIEEVVALACGITGSSLSVDEARELLAATGGWPAGLVAVLNARSGVSGLPWLTGPRTEETLADYLGTEVFDRLPLDLQRFLLDVAVVDEVTPEWCQSIDPQYGIAKFRAVERAQLFVEQVQGHPTRFRFHPIFHGFLRQRAACDGARWSALNLDASERALLNGDDDGVFRHLVAAERWQRAADFIITRSDRLLAEGRWKWLASSLDRLPADVLDSQPELYLARARAALAVGDVRAASSYAGRAFDLSKENSVRCRAMLVQADVARLNGNVKEALVLADEAVVGTSDAMLIAQADRLKGAFWFYLGDFERSIQHARLALEAFERSGDEATIAEVLEVIGVANSRRGCFDDAAEYLTRARLIWERLGNSGNVGLNLQNTAAMLLRRGEFKAANALLMDALPLLDLAGARRNEAVAWGTLGDARRGLAAWDEARQAYERSIEIAREVGPGWAVAVARDGQAACARAAGSLDLAGTLARDALALARASSDRLVIGRCVRTVAAVELDQNRPRQALRLLEPGCDSLATTELRHELMLTGLELARAQFAVKDRRAAENTLALVARMADEMGTIGPLRPLIQECRQVLEYGAQRPATSEFCSRLLLEADQNGHRMRSDLLLHVEILGTVRVSANGSPVERAVRGRLDALHLLVYLLVRPGSVSREQVVAALWPELPADRGRAALNTAVNHLRRVTSHEIIASGRDWISFNPAIERWFDYDAFNAAIRRASGQPFGSHERRAALDEAIGLYRGPFFSESFSDWAAAFREQVQSRFVRALRLRMRECLAVGDDETFADSCQRLLAVEPYDEEAAIGLLEGLGRLGRTSEAKVFADDYRRKLRDDLDLDVSAAMTEAMRTALGR